MTLPVPIVRVLSVENHPNADRLSIVTLNHIIGEQNVSFVKCISNKINGTLHRYQPGDLVAWIQPGVTMPVWLLKELDMWDSENNKGVLGGPDGNVVEQVTIRKVVSHGVMYPVEKNAGMTSTMPIFSIATEPLIQANGFVTTGTLVVNMGDDVAEDLGCK